MKLSFEKKKGNSSKKLKPGTYISVVLDIKYDDKCVDGTAIKIWYEIENEKGEKYKHSEIFHTGYYNSRTRQFYDYLEENGIDTESIDAFIGCHEKVVIKWNPTYKGTFPAIVEREFIDDWR